MLAGLIKAFLDLLVSEFHMHPQQFTALSELLHDRP